MEILFPRVFTDCAPANEAINNAKTKNIGFMQNWKFLIFMKKAEFPDFGIQKNWENKARISFLRNGWFYDIFHDSDEMFYLFHIKSAKTS